METSSPLQAKKYQTLLSHVWAILPGFCEEALDLGATLLADGGRLAKQLVSALLGEPHLREYVWLAFTRACDTTLEPPSALSKALRPANESCLRTLCTRILPEMFTAYTKMHTESVGQDASIVDHNRQIALTAVQSYIRIADAGLVGNLFKTLVARLLKATTADAGAAETMEKANAVPLADLANAMVPHLAAEFLDLVLKVFSPMLNSVNASGSEEDRAVAAVLQRAAYKALCGVMQHTAAGKIGDAARLLGLWPVLRDVRQTCTPSALKARLASIEALLLLLQERLASQFGNPAVRQEFLNCLQTILPEVMMHLRDPGTAVREAARSCLHVAATTALHQDMQIEVVTLISAGLAGLTPHSKAAAVDALSRLMFEHSTLIAEETQERLVTVVLLLLEDLDPKVWRAACKFVKVVIYVCSKEQTAKVLPQILRLFGSRHLASAKMLIRAIITRLIKVLPQDFLTEAFPKAHIPLLHYMQRQVARTGRPKAAIETKANSWERFSADDGTGAVEEDDTVDAPEVGRSSKRKKRARAGGDNDEDEDMGKSGDAPTPREPPTSAVMAHEAVQALLDAWEAESENEGGDRMVDARPGRKGKRKRDTAEAGTWIHEDKDVPLDFMSADAAHSVLTVRPPQQKRQRAQQVGSVGAENRVDALRRSGLRFSDDGRLVVDEEAAARTGDAEADGGGGGKLFNVGTSSKKKLSPLQQLAEQRKRRVAAKAMARMARKTHVVRGLDSYKPSKKKAQGDIRRKGTALQPYAYVRLNPKVVKEKHKDKSTASLSRVIKGAKQGVLKGLKARNRDQKTRQLAEARRQKRKQGKRPSKPNSR